MEFTKTEINLIDQIIWAHRQLDSNPLPSICLAVGVRYLSEEVKELAESGADFDAIKSSVNEIGHTLSDLENYLELLELTADRDRSIEDNLTDLLLDQYLGSTVAS